MGRLTVAKVRRIDRPGRYGDGDGLYLNVSRTQDGGAGAKTWIQRVTVKGRRCDIGLGPLWQVSLAEARDAAIDNRRMIRAGGDPLADRARSRKVPTFSEAAEAVIAVNRERWRGSRTEQNWRTQFTRYAFPAPWVTCPSTGSLRRTFWPASIPSGRRSPKPPARRVCGFARCCNGPKRTAMSRATSLATPSAACCRPCPSRRRIGGRCPMPRQARRWRPSPIARLPKRSSYACNSSFSRPAEAPKPAKRHGPKSTWTRPYGPSLPKRTKTGADHRVPLSTAALAVLKAAREIADGGELVFPSPHKPGRALSDMTLTRVLRVTGLAERATVHGFRTSFRTWASEQTSAPSCRHGIEPRTPCRRRCRARLCPLGFDRTAPRAHARMGGLSHPPARRWQRHQHQPRSPVARNRRSRE